MDERRGQSGAGGRGGTGFENGAASGIFHTCSRES
jgi:hypothetical protein